MVRIDDRIVQTDSGILAEMIGKRLISYKHDKFVYSDCVYRIVGMYIDKKVYSITNSIEVRDYYGTNEDVAVFKVSYADEKDIHSYIEGESLVDMPVNQVIKKIVAVNEHQRLFENGCQTYDVWLTRGIVIELTDGLEISFEKDIWYSEDISVKRGYRLEEDFSPIERVTDDWSEPLRLECERENIIFD